MARFVAELENGTRHKTLDTTEHAVESNQQTREQANQESEKALQSKIQNRSTERSRRSPKSKIQNLPPPTYRIHTLAGVMTPKLEANGLVTVDMGEPRLLAAEIPTTLGKPDQKVIDHSLEVAGQPWKVTCVSMGNPHCITFVEDVAAIPLDVLGPQFECHPAFPKKINTEFIQVVRSHDLKMRVWERGAGITLACGTGACAALVAAVLTGRSDRHATIELPGGSLQIEWAEASNRLYMTGPAERVFSGTMEP
ncbi:MAG: diaminopimelate epimerase [Leptolyngbyaceae cyanobacterium RU_5_1]|nr:diaminopimelate epimerase [Leptolyngbyaceae cyanobacterium RU_5_1]